MARIEVESCPPGVATRRLADVLRRRIASDGHVALDPAGHPAATPQAADALIVLLNGALDAPTALRAAHAAASGRAVIVLAFDGATAPAELQGLATVLAAGNDAEAVLPRAYAAIRPFAGRLVRDLVPVLARDAGHALTVRTAAPDERPRLLKRKIADEAATLLKADAGDEKEAIADLLEATEALIRERGHGRDDLKLVKQARLRRRGGFERFLVVESAAAGTGPGSAASAVSAAASPPAPDAPGATTPAGSTASSTASSAASAAATRPA